MPLHCFRASTLVLQVSWVALVSRVALAAGLLLATSAFAEAVPKTHSIWLVPTDAARGNNEQPVAVLVEGAAAEVLAQKSIGTTPWRIFITVDLPLITGTALQEVTDALVERAEHLAERGSVTISVRGSAHAVLLEDSRNPEEIADALVELGREGSRAGEYFEDRQTTLQRLARAVSEEDRRRLLLDHFHQEQELLEWQHHSLIDDLLIENEPHWMRGEDQLKPTAILLIRDDLGASTLGFIDEAIHSLEGGKGMPRLKRSQLDDEVRVLEQRLKFAAETTDNAINNSTRSIAATGAALFPLAWTSDRSASSSSETTRLLNDATASELAGGSGFRIGSASDIDRALAGLAAAIQISFKIPQLPESAASTVTPGGLSRGDDYAIRAINIASPFNSEGNRSFWLATSPPRQLTLARARRFFEGLDNGDLSVQAGLLGELAGGATLETSLNVESLLGRNPPTNSTSAPETSDRLRVTVLKRRLDQNLGVEQLFGGKQPLDKERWLLRSSVRLSRDLDQIAVLVEDLETGRWGAATAEEITESFEADIRSIDAVIEQAAEPTTVIATHEARQSGTRKPEPKRSRTDLLGEPNPTAASGRFKSPVLQLVAPARDRLLGTQKFAVLAATGAVRSVVFYLDGEEISRDDRAPFSVSVDLGASGVERRLSAAGFSASDLLLGTDEIQVNRTLTSEGLAITSLKRTENGGSSGTSAQLMAEASLRLREGMTLDRVEFYRNQNLQATMTSSPLRAAVGPRPTADAAARGDFVRVVAWLADGSFLEDVRLLGEGSDAGLGDFGAQVSVNLVQVFAVVTDEDGDPISGLDADDFTLELSGAPLTIERFSEAEQVPLDLALVVDTSESMWALMDDTRKAAARFLGDTISDEDRAMVVDFDNSVRLVHPLSGEVFQLIQALSKLKASGATALYDSIIFALVNLEDAARSRRAVVLLTDGEDFNSRFSYSRVYESARFAGVPLYFVALSDFFGDRRRGARKTDLEAFAKASGGQVFYVNSMEEILQAYGRITRELRNQYLLTFATDVGLSREELEKVKVKVAREATGNAKKVKVRWTVGSSK